MNILLVNDDGIYADGIQELAKALEKEHNISIVAPDGENSGKSQSINIYDPIIVKEVKLEGIKSKSYSVSSTPTDCVRIATDKLVKDIDLVISGVNRGLNVGLDVLYSGTVSAAVEGHIQGYPSLALSTDYEGEVCNYEYIIGYTLDLLKSYEKNYMGEKILLNINFPLNKPNSIEYGRIGKRVRDFYYLDSDNDRKKTYKILKREDINFDKDTDRYLLSKNKACITPLNYDFTDFNMLEDENKWYILE